MEIPFIKIFLARAFFKFHSEEFNITINEKSFNFTIYLDSFRKEFYKVPLDSFKNFALSNMINFINNFSPVFDSFNINGSGLTSLGIAVSLSEVV